MSDKLHKRLQKRIEEGTYRSLSSFDKGVDFWSNDYLGLARYAVDTDSEKGGATGSRLISGNSPDAVACEAFLATFFGVEAALVFNSGYDANLGFFSAVPQRGDLILYDEHIHASVRDGIRMSWAKAHSFAHNSVEDLKKKLKLGGEQVYVAVESLYSMGGDMAPLLEILECCEESGAMLVVDEAHTAGVFGARGEGVVGALGLQDRIFARLITFGKAYGAHGATILGSELLKNYLINFARPFIYTTALPPANYRRIIRMVELAAELPLRSELQIIVRHFRELIAKGGLISSSEVNAPIQVLRMTGEQASLKAKALCEKGYAVKAILPPTVAKGDECLRVCLHVHNTEAQLNELVKELSVH